MQSDEPSPVTVIPATWDAEVGGLLVLFETTTGNTIRPCLNKEEKKTLIAGDSS
jgi:hypothetical protein